MLYIEPPSSGNKVAVEIEQRPPLWTYTFDSPHSASDRSGVGDNTSRNNGNIVNLMEALGVETHKSDSWH